MSHVPDVSHGIAVRPRQNILEECGVFGAGEREGKGSVAIRRSPAGGVQAVLLPKAVSLQIQLKISCDLRYSCKVF